MITFSIARGQIVGATLELAERVVRTHYAALSQATRTVATQALLDYLGVTLAGAHEPLVRILVQQAEAEGGRAQATVIGSALRASVRQAALINGAAGHAHDYDDVHDAMTGHPTVPVAPAVLALGEHLGASGADVLAAFAAGVETECILGRYAGPSHYARGWHATGTLGTFGAAAAAARLLGFGVERTAAALGIAGTQAAGLKSQFGTMCKPLHAGHAAATGVEAAMLAGRGFESRLDILETPQGFMATQSDGPSLERFHAALAMPDYVPEICFKYHAACYMTHSAIEAARAIRATHALGPGDVAEIEVLVNQAHFGVCNIQQPASGLEAKFSLRLTVALALANEDTADIGLFTDTLATRPDLVALRDRVTVRANPQPRPETRVMVRTTDGRELASDANVAIPLTDLDLQWQRLSAKFRSLAQPLIGVRATREVLDRCHEFSELESLEPILHPLRTLS